MNLKHLTDKALLNDTKTLAAQYRVVTTKILYHLKEVERRRVFSDLGYSSLYDYVVKELGFAEASAIRRVQAARLLDEFPELEHKIESETMSLSNLAKVSQLFKNEKITDKEVKKEILERIEQKSARQCDKELLKIGEQKTPPKVELRSISPEYTVLKVVLTDENVKKYEEIKSHLAHRRLSQDQTFSLVFDYAIEKIIKIKFKVGKRESETKNPRYVTAQTKQQIYERDKTCQRCGGIYALEFDHIKPFALGGKTELSNLRLLCRSCNQRARIQKLR